MSLFYDYQDSFLLSRVNVHSMWTYLYTLTSRNKKTYHTPPNPPHFALVFFCAKRFFNLRRMIFQSAANDFPFCTDLFRPLPEQNCNQVARQIVVCLAFFRVSSNLVGINFQYSLYIPFFASWKTITYKCWHV